MLDQIWEVSVVKQEKYTFRAITRDSIHISQVTCSDIVFTASLLESAVSTPSNAHMVAAAQNFAT